ncbi:MAG: TonB-dependent receptor [Maricaulaceae bacterium]|nr:TonB-dependent receptor [Maricaulaceae bacterium]
MRKFTKSAALCATALFTTMAVAGTAMAQVEVITVTAQQREQTLQEVPVAVSAVTGEVIENAQIRDARDLQFLVPSLSVGQAASSTNVTFSIRTIGTDTFNPGLESSVGIFVDGVFLARQGAAINDFLSLERVEVLRGPQSTLFGRNTPAGVVSFITRRPSYDFGAEGELTFGNYNTRIARGTVTGPLVEDVLAFRLDGNIHQRDGFVENVHDGRDLNNRDRWSLRGQLLWEPSANTSVRFIADRAEIDENCCAAPFGMYGPTAPAIMALGGTLLPPDPWNYQVAIDGDVFTQTETWGLSAQVDHQFDGFTLTSITAYRDYDEFQNIDADFTNVDLAGDRLIRQAYDTFTQEVRLTSDGGGAVDWLAGAFYYRNRLNHNNQTPFGTQLRSYADLLTAPGPTITVPPGVPFTFPSTVTFLEALCNGALGPVPGGCAPGLYFTPGDGLAEDYRLNTTSWSVFGQVDWHLTDRFTLTLGGRYTRERKNIVADIDINDPFAAINFIQLGGNIVAGQLIGAGLPAGLVMSEFPNFSVRTAPGADCDPLAAPGTPGFFACITNPFLPLMALQFNPPANSFTASRSENNFSGNVILAYDLTDNVNVYGSYSRGFKPGGFNVSANAAMTGVFEFEEEIISNWELGLKALIFDNTTQVNMALFRQNLRDFQANIFTGQGFGLQNAGEVQITGLEFEFLAQPTDRLTFSGGFTWAWDSKYVDFSRNACPPSPETFPGLLAPGLFGSPEDVPPGQCGRSINPSTGLPITTQNSSGQDRQTPDWTVVLSAQYRQPVGDTLEAFLRGDYSYVGERTLAGNFNPNRAVGSTQLFNASIGLGAQDGSWMLQLWGRNLFNEEYQQGNFESVGQAGSINVYPGDPRTYGLTLRVRR